MFLSSATELLGLAGVGFTRIRTFAGEPMPADPLANRTMIRDVLRCLTAAAACLVMLAWCNAASAQETSETWYETDRINVGLEDPHPTGIDRSSPRQALRGFVNATQQGEYSRAAHYLNLSDLPPDSQQDRAPEIARKLASILARQVWIDWSALPARPDAMIEGSPDSNARAGQPRRNLILGTLETHASAYDLRLGRYKPADAPAVWLFTPQTVENVAALYDAFGPRRFESWIPQSLKSDFAGLWLWEWIALPLLAAGLLLLGLAARTAALSLSRKSSRPWLSNGLERSGMPVAILIMAGATQLILSHVISFSGPVQAVLRPTLIILMVWGVGMTALRLLDAVLHRVTLRYVGDIDDKRGADERELLTSIYALRRLIVLIMVGLAAIVVLAELNLFESIGLTLLASAGVLTVLLGIAGQAVLGNILASLQIAFAKPVRIGDSVLFEGDWAYVESIFYTFLRLRTWDHRRIVVPVTYFVSKPFENWSVAEARMMKVIELWLDHRADVAELRSYFDKLVREGSDISDSESAITYAVDQNAEGLKISFYAMMDDPSTGWAAQSRLREELMAYIRDHHPDWFPRERVQEVPQPDATDPESGNRSTKLSVSGSG